MEEKIELKYFDKYTHLRQTLGFHGCKHCEEIIEEVKQLQRQVLCDLYHKLDKPHTNGNSPQSISLSKLRKTINKMVEDLGNDNN